MSAYLTDLSGFAEVLCDALRVPLPGEVRGELGLFDELGLDSLGAFQLLVTLETMAGIELPRNDPPPMFTLADAHGYYRELCALGEP